jgi:hypothetical protein
VRCCYQLHAEKNSLKLLTNTILEVLSSMVSLDLLENFLVSSSSLVSLVMTCLVPRDNKSFFLYHPVPELCVCPLEARRRLARFISPGILFQGSQVRKVKKFRRISTRPSLGRTDSGPTVTYFSLFPIKKSTKTQAIVWVLQYILAVIQYLCANSCQKLYCSFTAINFCLQ